MNSEAIALTAVIGLVGGWLAGLVMKGGGYGLVSDTTLGLVGGVVGGFVLWMQGIAQGGSWFSIIVASFAGAFILVVAQRKFWNVNVALRG